MQHVIQPLIHKAQVMGLAVNVARTGLCLNDPAELRMLDEGRIGVYAVIRRPFLGVIPRNSRLYLGHLGPAAAGLVAPHMMREQPLRVRIVGLTPEHLAGEAAAEIHVSVWGELDQVIRAAPRDTA